jgi:hypothetical protein
MIHYTKQKINKKIKKLKKTKKIYIGGDIDATPDVDFIDLIQKSFFDDGTAILNITHIPYPTIFDFLAIEYNHDSLGNYKGIEPFNYKEHNPFYYGHLKELKHMYNFNMVDNNTNINLNKSYLNISPTTPTNYFNGKIDKRGIGDLLLLAIMCCIQKNGVNYSYNQTIFKDALKGMSELIKSPNFNSDWHEHIIPSAYKNNNAGMNTYDNFCSKCYMRSFTNKNATSTENYKNIYEKMDNTNSNGNHKDYFITNDASALYSSGLIHKTSSLNTPNGVLYRSNIIFSTVHSCDQMTNVKPESIKNLIIDKKHKHDNFKFCLYTDFDEYISNNTVGTAFKYNVKSEIIPHLDNTKGKRTITYETKPNCDAIFNNHPTDGRKDGFKMVNNELIMDKTSGTVSKENIIKYIKDTCIDTEKTSDPNWYKRAVLMAQFKRLGDYSQIDYCYNLPSFIIKSINDTYDKRTFEDQIRHRTMKENLLNNPADPNGGLSDLVNLLATAVDEDEKIKRLRKRIIHAAGDIPAFCWCIYNRINCMYYKEDKIFVCIIDYDS